MSYRLDMLEETYLMTLRQLAFRSYRDGLPPTMAQLATERMLSPAAIAKHYAKLVEAGLITHTKRSPRSAVLTAAGKKLVTRGHARGPITNGS